jgi:hypothetical protein
MPGVSKPGRFGRFRRFEKNVRRLMRVAFEIFIMNYIFIYIVCCNISVKIEGKSDSKVPEKVFCVICFNERIMTRIEMRTERSAFEISLQFTLS